MYLSSSYILLYVCIYLVNILEMKILLQLQTIIRVNIRHHFNIFCFIFSAASPILTNYVILWLSHNSQKTLDSIAPWYATTKKLPKILPETELRQLHLYRKTRQITILQVLLTNPRPKNLVRPRLTPCI